MTGRIVHVITGLHVGGAELALSRLARGESRFDHSVVSLSAGGLIGVQLSEAGIAVETLEVRKDPRVIMDIFRLSRSLERQNPVIVQTWLYHADLLAGLATRRLGLPVVWNLRQTDVAQGVHNVNTRIVIKLCAFISKRIPEKIVCGSSAALRCHTEMGYDASKMVLIRNGVDTGLFVPDTDARARIGNELSIDRDKVLVGRVARYHPQKGYESFMEMATAVAKARDNVVFLMIGKDVEWSNGDLASWIRREGLEERVYLLGERADIPKVMASLDIVVSSSVYGEGFPNVLAEGMACGVPAVTTDVGDSAEIVGDPERVVPAGDHGGLARAVIGLVDQEAENRLRIGMRDRQRVEECFGLEKMTGDYNRLYDDIARVSAAG